MAELFHRSFRVTVGDVEFESVDALRPLEFSFSVQRDKTITPNNVNLLFYNLSEERRDALGEAGGQEGVTVRLEAGYGQDVGQLFFGVLRKVQSWRKGGTWMTQLSGGDEEKNLTTSRFNASFKKGSPVTSLVSALVKTLKVDPGNLPEVLETLQVDGFLTGGSVHKKSISYNGDTATILESVLRSCGYEWSIQDGAFRAAKVGFPSQPGKGPLLTPQTGLLDTPTLDKDGKLVCKALLNVDLIPGKVFRVQSSRVEGNFLCEKTVHKGESGDSNMWQVEILATPPAPGSVAAEET